MQCSKLPSSCPLRPSYDERAEKANAVPLIFIPRGVSQTNFEIRAGSFTIGTVAKAKLSSVAGNREFHWHLMVSAAPPGFQRDGHAYSLEDAKAGIEAAWQTWIAAAGLTDPSSPPDGPGADHQAD
jgi:hypothetical protein